MLKPLYCTKEDWTYWNAAYSGDWKQKVGVTSSTLDPCFMTATCNQAKDAPHGIAAMLVDDTLMTGSKLFFFCFLFLWLATVYSLTVS
jgi:hypothetical protein